MNWDAIGAVGEVAGALGVIISLLYLAVQIRHSSKTAEDSATRDVFAAVGVQLATMVQEPNRDLVLKGLVEYRALSGAEKFTFDGLMGGLVILVESSVISNRANLLQDESMENWGFYLRPRFLAYQGFRDWWADSRGILVAEAQAWFDREIGKADSESDFWRIR